MFLPLSPFTPTGVFLARSIHAMIFILYYAIDKKEDSVFNSTKNT